MSLFLLHAFFVMLSPYIAAWVRIGLHAPRKYLTAARQRLKWVRLGSYEPHPTRLEPNHGDFRAARMTWRGAGK